MIEIDDVAVDLGGTRVLDGVDASIEAGRFVGLVGPNGAGKTTLLRTINGRILPSRGEVFVDSDPVSALSARELGRRVATVPQETNLAFEFDVRTIVEMGRNPHIGRLSLHDPGRGEVDRALQHTGTEGFEDRSVTTLSGGERQRVLLARALAQEAPVLLLDEPTANLDINHQVATLDLVRGLVDDGKTAIAAIHDLDLAARYCDELLLVHEGAIRAAGPPEDVLTAAGLEEAFGTRVAVSKNPVTGSPSITALSAFRGDLDASVHVVAGGGSGSPLLYPLVAAGVSVTVGPFHAGDPDAETADLLDLDSALGEPFSPFGEATIERARRMVEAADVTVLADVDVGPANEAALSVAGAADRLVAVEERPFEERNHAGPGARRRYERLRERARVVPEDEVVEAVAAVLDAGVEGEVPSLD